MKKRSPLSGVGEALKLAKVSPLVRRLATDPNLSPREIRFVAAYAVMDKGKEAAILAGYGLNRAKADARDLLRRPRVKKLIDAMRAQVISNAGISREFVVAGMLREAIDFSDGTPASRVSALGKLAEFLGMTERAAGDSPERPFWMARSPDAADHAARALVEKLKPFAELGHGPILEAMAEPAGAAEESGEKQA